MHPSFEQVHAIINFSLQQMFIVFLEYAKMYQALQRDEYSIYGV